MVEIKNDLFDISNRLKKIDKNYFIVFNKLKNRFEVHNKMQRGNTLAFCVDKNYLNCEVLIKAHKTNIRNSKQILKNIIENNKKLEAKNEEYLKQKSFEELINFIEYANKKGSDCNFDNVNKTIWV